MPSSASPRPEQSRLVRIGKRLRPWLNERLAGASLISNDEVLDASVFPWIGELEGSFDVIREEALAVLRHREAIPPLKDISPDHGRIAADGNWKSFFLYGYGYRAGENCERAPRTAAIVSRIPRLNSAFFSILAPGAHIPRHKGVTKGLVTCHLGLEIPVEQKSCHMQVGARDVHWTRGRCLVFDDTYEHEVWNDTDEHRVILLVQVKRPIRFPTRLLADAFLWGVRRTTFVQEARANLSQWENAYRRAEMNEPA